MLKIISSLLFGLIKHKTKLTIAGAGIAATQIVAANQTIEQSVQDPLLKAIIQIIIAIATIIAIFKKKKKN